MNHYIITYHYIRDDNPYNVNALRISDFEKQLNYFIDNFSPLYPNDLLNAVEQNSEPPPGFLLTFDDGLKEHYKVAYRLLRERGLSGIFFPNISHLIGGNIPLVNKLQVVLGKLGIKKLEQYLLDRYKTHPQGRRLNAIPSAPVKIKRLDNMRVQNIKYFMNFTLDEHVSNDLINDIFEGVVGDVRRYIAENFLTEREILEMHDNGMVFGGHSVTHPYLTSVDYARKEYEILESINYLSSMLGDTVKYFCYPYGHFDTDCKKILGKSDVSLAFTTTPEIHFGASQRYSIGRYDTIHFPPVGSLGPVNTTPMGSVASEKAPIKARGERFGDAK
ncbi:polysaccharide deacetylase family protein [Thiohalobacter sp. IOR34]|uniref:polysaccharide deacetylase family protein n=1 Tax=Thiohalobacter sp. IOR34 TaxID=3057176 RepID=UPI0025AEEF98|nr:polysaccharide deacetylase family protein [Thiohalobacter sp. IOR34]WJW76712.1 polysaccharide deacetylase family protein [Thiohalobacter sp. IOR34]